MEHEGRERKRNARKAFAPFVPFRGFRDSNALRSQLVPKRPVQHRRQQCIQLRLGGKLQGGKLIDSGLQAVQVGNDATLFVRSDLEHEGRERKRNARKTLAPFVLFCGFRDPNALRSQLPPKRPVQHRRQQCIQVGNDMALFVEGDLEHEGRERKRNARRTFAPFVPFRGFRDSNTLRSQLPPKRSYSRPRSSIDATMLLNCSRAACRSSTISWASRSGSGRFAVSSRLSSRSQTMSRLTLSRAISAS